MRAGRRGALERAAPHHARPSRAASLALRRRQSHSRRRAPRLRARAPPRGRRRQRPRRAAHRTAPEPGRRAEPVAVAADPVIVASGHDFFAAPRLSADGRRLAFLCWDHPRMPWDGTELRVLGLGDARPRRRDGDDRRRRGRVRVPAAVDPERRPALRQRSQRLVEPRTVSTPPGSRLRCAGSGRRGAAGSRRWTRSSPSPTGCSATRPVVLLPDGGLAAVFTRDGVDHLGVVAGPRVRRRHGVHRVRPPRSSTPASRCSGSSRRVRSGAGASRWSTRATGRSRSCGAVARTTSTRASSRARSPSRSLPGTSPAA